MLCTPKPNGFADHYPYEKWLFHWEYSPNIFRLPQIPQDVLVIRYEGPKGSPGMPEAGDIFGRSKYI